MSRLLLIRHAPTVWNERRLIQGRTDVPLSAAGRARAKDWRLPAEFTGASAHVSPLRRARETAALLGLDEARIDARLREMDFGQFEGQTLAALRAGLGPAMRRNEDRGWDFQPPGGESPRQAWRRLRPLLAELAAAGGDHVAVSHKSLIRIVMAAATDWPMLGKPPLRLDWQCGHCFRLGADGSPEPDRMNVGLSPLTVA